MTNCSHTGEDEIADVHQVYDNYDRDGCETGLRLVLGANFGAVNKENHCVVQANETKLIETLEVIETVLCVRPSISEVTKI